jgi:CubicO group peptidase (beta-lactamase class C family)
MRGRANAIVGAVLAGLLVAGAGAPAAAAREAQPENRADTAAVQRFMDRVLPEHLAALRIPGAAVSVVAAGRQVFAGGYGIADIDTGRPVAADSTTFPTDSVSKLFTGTAVMQLVERGVLDLDRDVNDYLSTFEIPDTFPGEPITLAHLLTHTAGFEERNVETEGDTWRPLGEYLAANQPERVRPPGVLPAYSNFGIALAGYIVEVQAGVAFESYIDEHIAAPLGMAQTTFDQSGTNPARAALTRTYQPDGDGNVAVASKYLYLAPAGAGVATVTDMSRFMLAHLHDGRFEDARILEPATAVEMHRQQFATDPRLPGMSYAFYNSVFNGHRAISHSGDGAGSHTLLTLFPEHDTGIYVAMNGDGLGIGAAAALEQLVQAFTESFLPPLPSRHQPIVAEQATPLAGEYRYTRLSGSDPSRLVAVAVTGVTVTANPDGTITTRGQITPDPESPDVLRWVPVGERLYQVDGNDDLLAFNVDERGEAVSFAVSSDATVAWERLSWWQTSTFHLAAAAVSLVVLLSVLVWPVSAVVRRAATRRVTVRPHQHVRIARPLAGLTTGLLVAFLAVAAYLMTDLDRFSEAVLGGTWELSVLLLLPSLAAVGAVCVVGCATLSWPLRWWALGARLHYSAVAIALIAFVVVAWEYNFLIWPS